MEVVLAATLERHRGGERVTWFERVLVGGPGAREPAARRARRPRTRRRWPVRRRRPSAPRTHTRMDGVSGSREALFRPARTAADTLRPVNANPRAGPMKAR